MSFHIKSSLLFKLLFGTYVRMIVSYYALFTLLGALLLMLPISVNTNYPLPFIDALFISASGMSTTGLSTVDISSVLSRFGQMILAIILQFGGVGLMLIVAGFFMVVGKRISLRERRMIVTDQNQLHSGGVIRLMKDTLFLIIYIEAFGFILLSMHFYSRHYFPLKEALFQAFFLTISLFTNAGFDITGDSLVRYANDYYVLSLSMILIFLGAVGFWALVEFKHFVFSKIDHQKFQFSMYVKLIFKMHLGLVLLGAIIIAFFENNLFLKDKSPISRIFYTLFMSLTTRNAGFKILDINQFSQGTKWILNGLMFIGSSPNSCGGGIRTTTFIVVVSTLFAFSTGKKQVILGRKAFKESTIYKSLIIFATATLLIFFSTGLISLFEEDISLHAIIFEVTSAFGTTGLSLGITSSLSFMSKLVLILNMFIGRVGILSFLLFFNDESSIKNRIKYPEYEIIIG